MQEGDCGTLSFCVRNVKKQKHVHVTHHHVITYDEGVTPRIWVSTGSLRMFSTIVWFFLLSIVFSSYSLRSRTSFVLVVRKEAHIYLWHGCKSSDDSRSTARAAAKKAQERYMLSYWYQRLLLWTIHLRALDSETRTTTCARFSQYRVLLTREPASFWRENVIAFVIVLRVLARMS